MRVAAVLSVGLLLGLQSVSAHLCNDVFAQAKDNLAVKVDIRDGQLRINQTASFRPHSCKARLISSMISSYSAMASLASLVNGTQTDAMWMNTTIGPAGGAPRLCVRP